MRLPQGLAPSRKLGAITTTATGRALFTAVTNRWVGGGGMHPWSGDVRSYVRIASAAPHLPAGPIGSAYTQRFGVHYLVGLISGLGLSLHASYRIIALVLALLVVVVAARVVSAV